MKNLLYIIALLGVLTGLSAQETIPIHRINAGRVGQATYGGKDFSPDAHYPIASYAGSPVSGIPEPYASDRYSWRDPNNGNQISNEMAYALPVQENGEYIVVLHFAEVWFGTARNPGSPGTGQRVFDVSIEGQKVLDDFDIFAEVGGFAPTTETFTAQVNDGTLDIYFSSKPEDGGNDLPKICAIEVLKVEADNVAVTGVSLSNTSLNLAEGANTTLSATVSPANAANTDVTWASSNNAVATVGQDGRVTAVSGGNATITVTTVDGGFSATATVTVTASNTNGDPQPPTVESVWDEEGDTASYAGNAAIGRATVPNGYRLAVEGSVRAREVRVDQDSWPDYVFDKGYDLPTLEEVQKHIGQRGHLPGIPSAKEVEANGMGLGEMDRLLLEKIEELTLYLIQQQAINKALGERVEKMEKD